MCPIYLSLFANISNMENDASHQDTAQNDHDEQEMNVPVLNERATKKCGKTFRRPFVFLYKKVDSVPQRSRLMSLLEEGRVQVVAFKSDTVLKKLAVISWLRS